MKKAVRNLLSVKDAVSNLDLLAGLDLKGGARLGIVQYRFVTDVDEFPESQIEWLSGEGVESVFQILEQTFQTLRDYLEVISKEKRGAFQEAEALITLAGEASEKVERFLSERMGHKVASVAEMPQYKALRELYEERFAKNIQASEPVGTANALLGDMGRIWADLDYELFHLRREDGTAFYTPEIVRRIRLSCDFEAKGESFETDPFLRSAALLQRDLQASARQILHASAREIQAFYRGFQKSKDLLIAKSLSSALMALFLAANEMHALEKKKGKSALQYFQDFHLFLREALRAPEYHRWVAYPEEQEGRAKVILDLAHSLCHSLYYRAGGVKQEVIGLIHRTLRRGKERSAPSQIPMENLWQQLSLEDEEYRVLLAKFPQGPLFKILDLVRMDEWIPFDPPLQGNFPMKLLSFKWDSKEIHLLHVPSPTSQAILEQAEIQPEWQGLLRSYQTGSSSKRHLMIQLQDRNGVRESARSRGLEALSQNKEFRSALTVITLPKATDFYLQLGEYEEKENAAAFLNAFQKQLENSEVAGFFFSNFPKEELKTFAASALSGIHRLCFAHRATLTRREREDFIEIFYQWLVLKMVEHFKPHSMSFTSKDGVDEGAAAAGSFYAFVRLVEHDLKKKEEQDFLRWLFYAPALLIRERALQHSPFLRALGSLEAIAAVKDWGALRNRSK